MGVYETERDNGSGTDGWGHGGGGDGHGGKYGDGGGEWYSGDEPHGGVLFGGTAGGCVVVEWCFAAGLPEYGRGDSAFFQGAGGGCGAYLWVVGQSAGGLCFQ